MPNHTTLRLPYKSMEDKFWAHVTVGPFTDCWLWHGLSDDEGYGRIYSGRHTYIKVHRFSYQLHYGEIPDGMYVLHTCDMNYPPGDNTNRLCCNPYHLYAGTPKQNAADMVNHGRNFKPDNSGSSNGQAKLTEADVIEIRALYQSGVIQRVIAQQFGIHQGTVAKLVLRKRWGHVP